jgi:hypothetical protein
MTADNFLANEHWRNCYKCFFKEADPNRAWAIAGGGAGAGLSHGKLFQCYPKDNNVVAPA